MGGNEMSVQERVLTSLYLEQLRILENQEVKQERLMKNGNDKEMKGK